LIVGIVLAGAIAGVTRLDEITPSIVKIPGPLRIKPHHCLLFRKSNYTGPRGHEASLWRRAAHRLLQPFCPTDLGPPRRAAKHVIRLAASWRQLPRYGRLRQLVEQMDDRLEIWETRIAASRISLPGWQAMANELSLALILKSVVISHQGFEENEIMLAAIGLHSLARRFGRAGRGDDCDILSDLNLLALHYPVSARNGGEFRVPAAEGTWTGAVMALADGQPIMAVRTFTPMTPAGSFRFGDVARLRA
jgi:hypothetical protein